LLDSVAYKRVWLDEDVQTTKSCSRREGALFVSAGILEYCRVNYGQGWISASPSEALSDREITT